MILFCIVEDNINKIEIASLNKLKKNKFLTKNSNDNLDRKINNPNLTLNKILYNLNNETTDTNELFEEKLHNLKNNIKDSFNKLLIRNKENQSSNTNSEKDTLNNIDNLFKSLLKNFTNSQTYREETKNIFGENKKEISETFNNLKYTENSNIRNKEFINKNEFYKSKNITKKNLREKFETKETLKDRDNHLTSYSLDKINKREKNRMNIKHDSSLLSNYYNPLKKNQIDEKLHVNESENFTKKFLSDVILKLISHPLHIDSDVEKVKKHSREKKANNSNKPNIVVISGSSNTNSLDHACVIQLF